MNAKDSQRRYRIRQKAKLEEFAQQVETLNRKLNELTILKAGLASQNEVLEAAAAAVEAKKSQEDAAAEKETKVLWDLRVGKHLAEFANHVRKDSLIVDLTEAEGQTMTFEEIRALVKEFYVQLQEAVGAGDVASTEAWLANLLRAKNSLRQALSSMSPRESASLVAKLYGDPEPPTLLAIRDAVALLNLGPDQIQELLGSRSRLLRKHTEIMHKRIGIVRRMQEAIQKDAVEVGEPEEGGHSRALLEACEAQEELKENLEREHESTYMFHSEFAEILSQYQFARSIVYWKNWGVKPWAVAQEVARQKGLIADTETNTNRAAAAPADASSSRHAGTATQSPTTEDSSIPDVLELDDSLLLDGADYILPEPLDMEFGQQPSGPEEPWWSFADAQHPGSTI